MEYDDTEDDMDTDEEIEAKTAPSSSLWHHSTMNTETGAISGARENIRR